MNLSETVLMMGTPAPAPATEGFDEALCILVDATLLLATLEGIDEDYRSSEEAAVLELFEHVNVLPFIQEDRRQLTDQRSGAYVAMGYRVAQNFMTQLRMYLRNNSTSSLAPLANLSL